MQKHTYYATSTDELPNIAHQIIELCSTKKIFILYAEMGAGKTTLIKAICQALGIKDQLSSPTYSIVNEYKLPDGLTPVFHIDLYRLTLLEEALDIGIEEYINGKNYCFIEWPQLIEPLLPDDVVRVEINSDEKYREISIFMS